MTLRLGHYREALADVVEVDTLITDPPYSERTHSGHDGAVDQVDDNVARRAISYAAWGPDDVRAFVEHWSPRVRGWMVILTDHVLIPAWERAFGEAGRYAFTPLACVVRGSRVRLLGDGPSQWSVFAMVARPKTREMQRWGTLPGAYVGKPERNGQHIGGKPVWLMRALVRDYSRQGGLVCDPCAGYGTTLQAARLEGRRFVGAEIDPDTYATATTLLTRPYTPDLFGSVAANDNGKDTTT